ncbi:hypothetical protein ACWDUI_26260, partial [Streptosporangium sandarakinum]
MRADANPSPDRSGSASTRPGEEAGAPLAGAFSTGAPLAGVGDEASWPLAGGAGVPPVRAAILAWAAAAAARKAAIGSS